MLAGHLLPVFMLQVYSDRLGHTLKYFIQLWQDDISCHKSKNEADDSVPKI
jgi:hypothetical protein